jgi:AcrR family transcriptional regulator
MKETKKQDIVRAALELFARKGFRGTTTRDLATHAEVNEAIIFRYFNTKEELYRAILEEKVSQSRDQPCAELEELARSGDDRAFLEAVGQKFLEKHEQDTTFMRLLLFSALEGHELSEMFVGVLAARDPLAEYFARRMEQGAIQQMDPHLAARLFIGMFVSFVQQQEIFGMKINRTFDRNEVVRTFVSIFLNGIKQ